LGSENQQKKRTCRLTLLPDHPIKALEDNSLKINILNLINKSTYFGISLYHPLFYNTRGAPRPSLARMKL
jgi:hypothetical protein